MLYRSLVSNLSLVVYNFFFFFVFVSRSDHDFQRRWNWTKLVYLLSSSFHSRKLCHFSQNEFTRDLSKVIPGMTLRSEQNKLRLQSAFFCWNLQNFSFQLQNFQFNPINFFSVHLPPTPYTLLPLPPPYAPKTGSDSATQNEVSFLHRRFSRLHFAKKKVQSFRLHKLFYFYDEKRTKNG